MKNYIYVKIFHKNEITGSFFSLDWNINIIYAKTLWVHIRSREKYFPLIFFKIN